MPTKCPRGRPPRDDIDQLAARVWFTAVSEASGLPAGKLEHHLRIELAERYGDDSVQTNAWYGYQRGSRSPSEKLLEIVERRYPGTAAWHQNLMWPCLKKEKIAIDDAVALLSKLSPEGQSSLDKSSTAEAMIELSRTASVEIFGALFLLQKSCVVSFSRRKRFLMEACRRWLFLAAQNDKVVQRHWIELIEILSKYAPELGDLNRGLIEFKARKNSEGFMEHFYRGFMPGVYLDEEPDKLNC